MMGSNKKVRGIIAKGLGQLVNATTTVNPLLRNLNCSNDSNSFCF